MRLGTKITLLTLALVVTLTAAVVFVVRERVRAQELARVPAEIHRAVAAYFARVDAAAENTLRAARLLFGEQSTRADLSNLNSPEAMTPDERQKLELRFCNDLFGTVMQRELEITLLDGSRIAPAFHVLFNEAGEMQIVAAPRDPELTRLIREARIDWNPGEITEATDHKPVVRYVQINTWMFVALGVPVSTVADESEPPTNAYFVGYALDVRWAKGFVPGTDGGGTPLGVWFSGSSGANVSGGSPGHDEKYADIAASMRRESAADGVPRAIRVEPPYSQEVVLAEVAAYPLLGAEEPTLTLAVTASLDRALAPMQRLLATITLTGVVAVIVAFVACRLIASRIARPVRALVKSADDIGAGRFDVHLDTCRKDEIGDLARSFEHMAQGLAQRDFIKDTFGKFVDPSVVAGLIADPQRLRPGGEERVQTVLMSDIEGFTALSEKLRPEQVVELLNAFLGAAADIIAAERGVVDKFIGDAVVAFWGPPLTEDHAPRAGRAALRMIEAARALSPRCEELGIPPLRVRIGIATGEVLVGNIGSASKFNYTVMGDTVNLAARLEGLNKVYRSSVLCEANAAAAMGTELTLREIDLVRVVGRAAPTRVFEVAGVGEDQHTREHAQHFEQARSRMLAGDFAGARAAFEELARRERESGPAQALGARCAELLKSPPPPEWDGVFEPDRK